MKKKGLIAALVLAVSLAVVPAAPEAVHAETTAVNMFRLYNPNSGEHFYTADAAEKESLVSVGWAYEGIGWVAPSESGTPVYRLYNANAGDHHYTMSADEKAMLESVGWSYEGIGWYSDDAQAVPLYRQYNPNAQAGSHNYTTSSAENDALVAVGWQGEGIGWYALETGFYYDENHDYVAGESFVYESFDGPDFKVKVGDGYKIETVNDSYSEYNGKQVVGIPVTFTNLSSENASMFVGEIDKFSGDGTESPWLEFKFIFDDEYQLYNELRPGASVSGYIYILYTGPGTYVATFNNYDIQIDVVVPVA